MQLLNIVVVAIFGLALTNAAAVPEAVAAPLTLPVLAEVSDHVVTN